MKIFFKIKCQLSLCNDLVFLFLIIFFTITTKSLQIVKYKNKLLLIKVKKKIVTNLKV